MMEEGSSPIEPPLISDECELADGAEIVPLPGFELFVSREHTAVQLPSGNLLACCPEVVRCHCTRLSDQGKFVSHVVWLNDIQEKFTDEQVITFFQALHEKVYEGRTLIAFTCEADELTHLLGAWIMVPDDILQQTELMLAWKSHKAQSFRDWMVVAERMIAAQSLSWTEFLQPLSRGVLRKVFQFNRDQCPNVDKLSTIDRSDLLMRRLTKAAPSQITVVCESQYRRSRTITLPNFGLELSDISQRVAEEIGAPPTCFQWQDIDTDEATYVLKIAKIPPTPAVVTINLCKTADPFTKEIILDVPNKVQLICDAVVLCRGCPLLREMLSQQGSENEILLANFTTYPIDEIVDFFQSLHSRSVVDWDEGDVRPSWILMADFLQMDVPSSGKRAMATYLNDELDLFAEDDNSISVDHFWLCFEASRLPVMQATSEFATDELPKFITQLPLMSIRKLLYSLQHRRQLRWALGVSINEVLEDLCTNFGDRRACWSRRAAVFNHFGEGDSSGEDAYLDMRSDEDSSDGEDEKSFDTAEEETIDDDDDFDSDNLTEDSQDDVLLGEEELDAEEAEENEEENDEEENDEEEDEKDYD